MEVVPSILSRKSPERLHVATLSCMEVLPPDIFSTFEMVRSSSSASKSCDIYYSLAWTYKGTHEKMVRSHQNCQRSCRGTSSQYFLYKILDFMKLSYPEPLWLEYPLLKFPVRTPYRSVFSLRALCIWKLQILKYKTSFHYQLRIVSRQSGLRYHECHILA